jgi:DNA polymerase I
METINLTKSDIEDFKAFISEKENECIKTLKFQNFVELYFNTNQKFIVPNDVYNVLYPSPYANDLIFGKDKTENIVSVEADGDNLVIFKETVNGVTKEVRKNTFWLLTNEKVSSKQVPLLGEQHYKWMGKFHTLSDYLKAKKNIYAYDHYKISDLTEASLVYHGMTYFKGMTVADVSVLSFDIETDGLKKKNDSEVYLITNTFRRFGVTEKKTFRLDRFKNQPEMLKSWCEWVREKNPSVMLGHNVLGYDIPYLMHVGSLHNMDLKLGRDNSVPNVASYTSKFRKDMSQSYEYNNINIYGREIVDTFFLSIKFDVARNFESYGLKPIIKHLKMEKPGRTFVDASKIKQYYNNRHQDPEMWEKVVMYAEEDSDDALKLYDLMAPNYFYFNRSVSKSWQQMINSATGSQFNNMMVRGYFQEGKSIAKADEKVSFPGAISFGIPGLYKNTYKLDVASLYPSVIRHYRIYSKEKDPEQKFLQIMDYFTIERLKNKEIAEQTGDVYFENLSGSQKIVINTGYGFMGAPGLNYNYFKGAAETTFYGREILNKGVLCATGKSAEEWASLVGPDEDEEENDEAA